LDNRGIVPRVVESIFENIEQCGEGSILVSCMEIYQEKLKDLLCKASEKNNQNLKIRESAHGIWVEVLQLYLRYCV
jgi:hypothetical protein